MGRRGDHDHDVTIEHSRSQVAADHPDEVVVAIVELDYVFTVRKAYARIGRHR